METEVNFRVKEASKCLGGMKSVMRNRYLGMDAKRRLYKGVIVPTVLYGAETEEKKRKEKRSKEKKEKEKQSKERKIKAKKKEK